MLPVSTTLHTKKKRLRFNNFVYYLIFGKGIQESTARKDRGAPCVQGVSRPHTIQTNGRIGKNIEKIRRVIRLQLRETLGIICIQIKCHSSYFADLQATIPFEEHRQPDRRK